MEFQPDCWRVIFYFVFYVRWRLHWPGRWCLCAHLFVIVCFPGLFADYCADFPRAATLQKCGSEIFLRFPLPKMSWNLAWNFGEIFRATFSRVWVCDGNFTKISRQKRCEKRKISRKLHSAGRKPIKIVVSSDFLCTLSYHFVFFCAQLSGNFLKIAFFKKRVQKLGFSIFCFKFKFWKFSFLGLLKHYKNRGFSNFCVFCCWKRRKRQKNDNWNFWIWFFGPKMAVSWRIMFFSKKVCWNPYFYSVLGCALFGPSCQKREIWTPTKKEEKIDW